MKIYRLRYTEGGPSPYNGASLDRIRFRKSAARQSINIQINEFKRRLRMRKKYGSGSQPQHVSWLLEEVDIPDEMWVTIERGSTRDLEIEE